MKIAITCPGGAESPAIWSGTPYGILSALKAQGHEVCSVDVAPPAKLGSLYIRLLRRFHPSLKCLTPQEIRLTTKYSKIFSIISQIKLALICPELTIQIGTGYRVKKSPYVTFEDMTVVQACKYGWGEGWDQLPQSLIDERIEQQRIQYEDAEVVFVATDWAAESVISDYAIDPRKVRAIGLGSNKPAINKTLPRGDWSNPKFIFIGNDWKRKNGDLLLKAFKIVQKQFPQAELHLVGDHPEVLQTNVIGHGKFSLGLVEGQKKLSALIDNSTCLVVPSIFEPAGIVYVEAGNYGVSSIGTKNGGAAYMIGAGGITVNPTGIEELVKAMLKMCDSTAVARMGEYALENSKYFTWEKVSRRIIEFYK